MLLAEGYVFRDEKRFDYRYGYFLPWKDAMVPTLRDQGAPVVCFDAKSSARCFASAVSVAQWLRRERADILHCHLPVASVVGRLAGAMARVPVVGTEHNLIEGYHPLTRAATKATWSLQDYVIAVSREVEASIARNCDHRVSVETVVNGVATRRFTRLPGAKASLRARLSLPHDARVVGTVTVFRKHKRLDLWVRAARQIAERDPLARFVLVGDGPLMPDVRRWVSDEGLGDRVSLPGLIEDVRPWVSGFDVYMMSSDVEGLPVAMLEAMSMEVPCVVTRVGGIGEALRDGVEGQLVERGDVGALVDRTAALLADEDARRRMGTAARARVEQEFGMRRMVAALEAVYERVLS